MVKLELNWKTVKRREEKKGKDEQTEMPLRERTSALPLANNIY